MRIANEDYPYKEFPKPATGIIEATVCSVSGKLLSSACGDHSTTKVFLEGSQPTQMCDYHVNRQDAAIVSENRLENERYLAGISAPYLEDDSPLVLDLSFLYDTTDETEENTEQNEAESDEDSFSSFFDNFLSGFKKPGKKDEVPQVNTEETVEENETEKEPENFLFD